MVQWISRLVVSGVHRDRIPIFGKNVSFCKCCLLHTTNSSTKQIQNEINSDKHLVNTLF